LKGQAQIRRPGRGRASHRDRGPEVAAAWRARRRSAGPVRCATPHR